MTKYESTQNLNTQLESKLHIYWKEIDILLPEQHNSKAFSFRKKPHIEQYCTRMII